MKRKLILRRVYLYILSMVLLPAVRLLLRIVGYKRLSQWMVWLSPEPQATIGQGEWRLGRARLTGGLVGRAARKKLIRGNCLERSIVLWWLLRWQRIGSQIRVGMGKQDGNFTAHAWVEMDGVVVNDKTDVAADFVTFSDAVAPEQVVKFL